MEFRIFICNKKITAATQYCYMSYFPKLVQKKEKIRRIIHEFIGEILEFLPYENAVVDILIHEFALNDDTMINLDKRNTLNAQIIEINPFFGDTGACLFSWREPSDVEILKNGPFQLRIRENPLDQPYNALPWDWGTWIMDFREIPRKKKVKKETKSHVSYIGLIGVALIGIIAVVCIKLFFI